MTTTALITGATSGIGRAAADKLAQSGVHVMVVGRNVDRGEKTIAEIRATGGKADFIASDLRDAASARAVARKAVELGGGHIDMSAPQSSLRKSNIWQEHHPIRARLPIIEVSDSVRVYRSEFHSAALRTGTFRAHSLLSSRQFHQHLSEVLALEQLEEGCRCIFDAFLHALFPHELAIAYPPGQVLIEFR